MRREGTSIQRREEKISPSRGREGAKDGRGLGRLFLCVSLSLGLSYVNWAGQECCWFYLRFSLRPSDLPFLYFRGLPLLGLLATAILDSFSLF